MKSAVARILDDLEQRGGLKGSDVANIVNVSRPTVSRWKSGKASPPLATQTIIADLRFSVREAAILFGLFVCQLLLTDAVARYALSGLYLLMTFLIIYLGGAEKRRALRELPAFLVGRRQ